MEPFGLVQMVSDATRVTPSYRTLIDHIYTNCTENVNLLNVPKIGLSDHFSIFFYSQNACATPEKKAFHNILQKF